MSQPVDYVHNINFWVLYVNHLVVHVSHLVLSVCEPFDTVCEPFGTVCEPFGTLCEPFGTTCDLCLHIEACVVLYESLIVTHWYLHLCSIHLFFLVYDIQEQGNVKEIILQYI